MRILVYGLNYSPELTGIGKYTGEMCSYLAGRGHEVRVVTAPPYYPEWRIREGYSAAYRSETIDGVRVSRCPLWVPARPTGAKRVLHLLSFAASSLPAALAQSILWRPDIVFTVEPAFFCASGAWLCARLSGARAWLHIQDFEMDAAFDLGLVGSGFIRGVAKALERRVTSRFDRVSTISPRMFDRLPSRGASRARSVLFPNWVDTDKVYPLSGKSPLRDELGIPDGKVVLLYSGNMGEKQGLDIIVKAAAALKERMDMLFLLCGEGSAKKRLLSSSKGLSNIRFIPLQPVERLNDLLNAADIHLLPQRADVADLVMPSKLLGICASGRPVVATAHPGTQVAEAVKRCGVAVTPGDAPAFSSAITQLADDTEKRLELGRAARSHAIAHWGVEEVLGRAVKAMEDCAADRASSGGRGEDPAG
ncbi:MAG: glycosyltransferase WbuB [Deltaproteobacteria bacterium]|nr:glycosyltransferase WbuB [Deltaproteobacteria bacterium]